MRPLLPWNILLRLNLDMQAIFTHDFQMKKFLVFGLLLLGLAGSSAFSNQARSQISVLLDQIAKQMDSYAELKNWSATVLSTSLEMDKHWKEKKKTVKETVLTVRGEKSEEEILKAFEVKKGKTKDITRKVKAKAAIKKAKARQKQAKNSGKKGKQTDGGSFSVSLDDLFPFKTEKRDQYEFARLDDTMLNGRAVYVLEVRARVPADKNMEGLYFVDKVTLDVMKAELHPSKKHKALKQFKIELLFHVLPGNYFVLKEMNMKLHVGLVIKNIRREEHVIYKDYKILD